MQPATVSSWPRWGGSGGRGGELAGPSGVVVSGLRAAGQVATSGIAQVLVMGLMQFNASLTSMSGQSALSASLSMTPNWGRKKRLMCWRAGLPFGPTAWGMG